MKTTDLVQPNHPQFRVFLSRNDGVIATFRVGYYQQPPAEVIDAAKRIQTAIDSLTSDIAAVREWSGSVIFYGPQSKILNPEITDSMRSEFIRVTEEANPDWQCVQSWDSTMHGLHGFSVLLHKRKETTE